MADDGMIAPPTPTPTLHSLVPTHRFFASSPSICAAADARVYAQLSLLTLLGFSAPLGFSLGIRMVVGTTGQYELVHRTAPTGVAGVRSRLRPGGVCTRRLITVDTLFDVKAFTT